MGRRSLLAVAPTLALSIPGPGSSEAIRAPAACASPVVEAVADRIAETFDRHRFVFIGSTHGDAKIDEFLRCLVTRPAFYGKVTDIVVEYATPFHQALMDRYLLQLAPMPVESLAPVWFDTDNPTLWASLPQIPAFFCGGTSREHRSSATQTDSDRRRKRAGELGGRQGAGRSRALSVQEQQHGTPHHRAPRR